MKSLKILGAVATLLLAPAMAEASVINVRDNPDNGVSEFGNGLVDAVDVVLNGSAFRATAGAFSLQYQQSGDDFWTDFMTFCLQIDQRLRLPNGYERENAAAYLGDAGVLEAIGIIYGNFLNEELGFANAQTAAGLQVLLWEIVEDGVNDFDLSSGNFAAIDADIVAEAETFWALIQSGLFEPAEFSVFVSANSQDLIGDILSEVPLPGAVLLMLTGLAGLRAASRKKKSALATNA